MMHEIPPRIGHNATNQFIGPMLGTSKAAEAVATAATAMATSFVLSSQARMEKKVTQSRTERERENQRTLIGKRPMTD